MEGSAQPAAILDVLDRFDDISFDTIVNHCDLDPNLGFSKVSKKYTIGSSSLGVDHQRHGFRRLTRLTRATRGSVYNSQ